MVARVLERVLREELLLDHARAGESPDDIKASSFIVSATGTRTSEGLLAD